MKVYKLNKESLDFLKSLLCEEELDTAIGSLEYLANEGIPEGENHFSIPLNNNHIDLLHFRSLDFDLVDVYDPNSWNEFPRITPPLDTDMRVELDDGLRYCARYHKFSDGCFWVSTNGACFPNYLNHKVVRFRPWED